MTKGGGKNCELGNRGLGKGKGLGSTLGKTVTSTDETDTCRIAIEKVKNKDVGKRGASGRTAPKEAEKDARETIDQDQGLVPKVCAPTEPVYLFENYRENRTGCHTERENLGAQYEKPKPAIFRPNWEKKS